MSFEFFQNGINRKRESESDHEDMKVKVNCKQLTGR